MRYALVCVVAVLLSANVIYADDTDSMKELGYPDGLVAYALAESDSSDVIDVVRAAILPLSQEEGNLPIYVDAYQSSRTYAVENYGKEAVAPNVETFYYLRRPNVYYCDVSPQLRTDTTNHKEGSPLIRLILPIAECSNVRVVLARVRPFNVMTEKSLPINNGRKYGKEASPDRLICPEVATLGETETEQKAPKNPKVTTGSPALVASTEFRQPMLC